jgi:hypothetical protein
MWDVLVPTLTKHYKGKCLDNVISNMKSGSIIVFHDSIKAFENLKYALPKTLEFIEKINTSMGL